MRRAQTRSVASAADPGVAPIEQQGTSAGPTNAVRAMRKIRSPAAWKAHGRPIRSPSPRSISDNLYGFTWVKTKSRRPRCGGCPATRQQRRPWCPTPMSRAKRTRRSCSPPTSRCGKIRASGRSSRWREHRRIRRRLRSRLVQADPPRRRAADPLSRKGRRTRPSSALGRCPRLTMR